MFRFRDWQKQHNAPVTCTFSPSIIALVVPFYTTVLEPIYRKYTVLDGSPVDQLTNYITVQIILQKTGSYLVKFTDD